uniref:Uncharacterized protein n=1 Tax=Denticeps clupeoides TaxID=299321 RepID=A0AAY4DGM1_9TELE
MSYNQPFSPWDTQRLKRLKMAWLIFTCAFYAAMIFLFILKKKIWAFQTDERNPPSLPSWPIIGSLLSLRSDRAPHVFFQELQEKYGDVYSLMMGSHNVIIVNSHHYAKEVLLKKGKTFAGRPRTVNILTRDGKDNRFYCAPGPQHVRDGSASIEQTSELRHLSGAQASAMCDVLEGTQSVAVDLAPELTRAVTNVVCSLCFSSSYKRGDPEFESMLQYSQGIVDTVAKDSLVDIFPWLQIFPNEDLRILKECVSVRDKLLETKYREHKADYSDSVQRDLLDALLRAKRSSENNNTSTQGVGLTDDHLLMTVGDIFGAGVETTTTVLKWSIVYLVHYPEVGTRRGRHPQLSDRGNLPYLAATIREVLRIRPVSPLLIPHVAVADTSIGEYAVKKGARVIVNLWSLHHDQREWKNPDLFDPGESRKHNPGCAVPSASYLPFGAGVRVCLGEALAKMELFLFLSWLLHRFTLEMPAGQPLPSLDGKFGVVLQPQKFKVHAHPRPGWKAKRGGVIENRDSF